MPKATVTRLKPVAPESLDAYIEPLRNRLYQARAITQLTRDRLATMANVEDVAGRAECENALDVVSEMLAELSEGLDTVNLPSGEVAP